MRHCPRKHWIRRGSRRLGPCDNLLADAMCALLNQNGYGARLGLLAPDGSPEGEFKGTVLVLSAEPIRIESDFHAQIERLRALTPALRIVSGIYTDDEIHREILPAGDRLPRAASAKQVIDLLHSH